LILGSPGRAAERVYKQRAVTRICNPGIDRRSGGTDYGPSFCPPRYESSLSKDFRLRHIPLDSEAQAFFGTADEPDIALEILREFSASEFLAKLYTKPVIGNWTAAEFEQIRQAAW
jgi:hypothetical protein